MSLVIYSLHLFPKESVCIGCGCSDSNACFKNNQACSWLKVDRQTQQGVCSNCPEFLSQLNSKSK